MCPCGPLVSRWMPVRPFSMWNFFCYSECSCLARKTASRRGMERHLGLSVSLSSTEILLMSQQAQNQGEMHSKLGARCSGWVEMHLWPLRTSRGETENSCAPEIQGENGRRREQGSGLQEEAGYSGHIVIQSCSHGAVVMGTLEHLEVGEEDCVQVIKSLINVLPWRMCVTAQCTTRGWKVTVIKHAEAFRK